jgi:hypothetical protein
MKHISPFKFLDSFQKDDFDVFFGRENETERLYDALSGVKLLMVYGPSGAGKTSLIECGLRNQFSDADWLAITVRRGGDMNTSVFARIREQLQEPFDLDLNTQLPVDSGFEFGHAVERLFAEQYKPVYLLFDQFEELLIQGDDAEKQAFFTNLNRLTRYKTPCRVLLIMREEFVGHLSEFESLCPYIFEHRFRLEKMGRSNVRDVVKQTLNAPKYNSAFVVDDSDALANQMLAKLPDTQREIELAHVQVFLSELWDRAYDASPIGTAPRMHVGLIRPDDHLEAVLDSFLKAQLQELKANFGEKLPLELLASLISERHTKLQLSEAEIAKDLRGKDIEIRIDYLRDLLREFERRRIVRLLKAGDKTNYEITHDVLAFLVGQNLTQEMQLREKARDIYKVYTERKGYFTQDDLDYLRPYQQYLAYPVQLASRIRESETFIVAEQQRFQREKEEQLEAAKAQAANESLLRDTAEQGLKRARNFAFVAVIVAIIAFAAMVWAFFAQFQTEMARKEAQERLERWEVENKARILAEERIRQVKALKPQIARYIRVGEKGLAGDSLKVLERLNPKDPDIDTFYLQLK